MSSILLGRLRLPESNEDFQICKIVHGSHLYGLNTPQSDMDYKSIYLPSLRSVMLDGPRTHQNRSTSNSSVKNTSKDVDDSAYSLRMFLDLCCKGEMIAMDMLHSENSIIETSLVWNFIVQHRQLFYTKSMSSYLGYVRQQVGKYGAKGSRLNALTTAIEALCLHNKEARIEEIWDSLPVDSEFLFKLPHEVANKETEEVWQVLGKMYTRRTKVKHVLESLQKTWEEYGMRARRAANSEGVDWKAVSHAFRACLQLKQLFNEGRMILPFTGEDRSRLLQIKLGQIPWPELDLALENDLLEVNRLAAASSFPETVDKAKVDELYLQICRLMYKFPVGFGKNPAGV